MYKQTPKAKAMMAARLIEDVDCAPIVTQDLVRAATAAACILEGWVRDADDAPDLVTGSDVALAHLRRIEAHARSVESYPVSSYVLAGLRAARVSLQRTMRQRVPSAEGGGSDSSLEFSEEGEDLVPENEPVPRMPQDVRQSISLATTYRNVLWLLLCAVLCCAALAIVLVHRRRYTTRVAEMNQNVTEELSMIAEASLEFFREQALAAGVSPLLLPSLGAAILSDMTSSKGSSTREKFMNSDNYLAEYRGAVKNYRVASRPVTAVRTPWAFGGICKRNETFTINRINDVDANQTYIAPIITANRCGDDAAYGGIFTNVYPGFQRYRDFALTYRRSGARVGNFYAPGFDLSVAVTRDRETLQDFMTPSETLLGYVDNYKPGRLRWAGSLSLWCGLALAVAVLLEFILLVWMMKTKMGHWRILFSVAIGVIAACALAVVLLISQSVLGSTLNEDLLVNSIGLLDGVVGALLSEPMLNYSVTMPLMKHLAGGLLAGRLVAADQKFTFVEPPELLGLLESVDGEEIGSYRRGQYAILTRGYALAVAFIKSMSMNVFMLQKLPSSYEANWTISIVLLGAALCGASVYLWVQYTPLRRLRSYGMGSTFLYFFLDGSSVRYFFYAAVFVASLAGSALVGSVAVADMRSMTTELAEDSLILLSAALRSPSIADRCTNNCGMPDFIMILYFTQYTDANGATDVTSLDYDIPLPYPLAEGWERRYMGSQLALSNLHTSIMNAPSFATPFVNRTTNVTDPRYIIRRMMVATGINSTAGFAVERFPASYKPSSFDFCVKSIGICGMLGIAAIVSVVCEVQYMTIHERRRAGRSVRRPVVIMALGIIIVLASFIAFGGALRPLLRREILETVRKEMCFLCHAIKFRLELISLERNMREYDVVLKEMQEDAQEISDTVMVLGKRYLRVRIAREYPYRGSGTVRIAGVRNEDVTTHIGPLDMGNVPNCGEIDSGFVAYYVSGTMNYCYTEIAQNTLDTLHTPRMFLMVSTSVETWVDNPTKQLWPRIFGTAVLLGVLVAMVLGVVLLMTLLAADATGFVLLKEADLMSFSEKVSRDVTTEFFIPRNHRHMWILSILFLAAILVYFHCEANNFAYAIKRNYDISVSFETQAEIFEQLASQAQIVSYNYVLYPFSDVTNDKLLEMSRGAAAGTLDYVFITEPGRENFQAGVEAIYRNTTYHNTALEDMLAPAKDGYATYTSVVALQYEQLYISKQDSMLALLGTLVDRLTDDARTGTAGMNYVGCLSVLKRVLELDDLLRKLFVLDHMMVTSYATIVGRLQEAWPFVDDKEKLETAAQDAAGHLQDRVRASFSSLKRELQAASPYSQNVLVYLAEEIINVFPATYAMGSVSSPIWELQRSRCKEAMNFYNKTQHDLIQQKKREQLASIQEQGVRLTRSREEEMTARKTYQMMDYLRDGQPLENEQTRLTWQRWDELKALEREYRVSFGVSAASFIAVGACILLQWRLLRQKTLMTQRDVTVRVPYDCKKGAAPGTGRAAGAAGGKDDASRSSASEDKKLNISGSSESAPQHPNAASPLDDSLKDLMADLTNSRDLDNSLKDLYKGDGESGRYLSPMREAERRAAADAAGGKPPPRRASRSVALPVGACLVLTMVPLTCTFAMLCYAHHTAVVELKDISVVLALYMKVIVLIKNTENIALNSVRYYLGVLPFDDYWSFLVLLERQVIQLGAAYKWLKETASSSIVLSVERALEKTRAGLLEELDVFQSIQPASDIPPYAEAQSAYARTVLASLTDADTYGALIPVAATTDGSAVHAFAEESYAAAVASAAAAATQEAFFQVYTTYHESCRALDRVSQAELQMWHAAVAGARMEAVDVAVQFSTFTALVGEAGLAALAVSPLTTAAAALAEVQAHFQRLLTDAGTTEQVVALFTETDAAPPLSTPPVSSDAYFAAAFVAHVLTSRTTEVKFANIFAYNRRLTPHSAMLEGREPLVDAVMELRTCIETLFLRSGTNNDTVIIRAEANKWIWFTEVSEEYGAISDHADIIYLMDAVRWCGITSFWCLVLTLFVMGYLLFSF